MMILIISFKNVCIPMCYFSWSGFILKNKIKSTTPESWGSFRYPWHAPRPAGWGHHQKFRNQHSANLSSIWYIMTFPDSKVHGTNIGPIRGRQDPGGPHVGPINFAIWVMILIHFRHCWSFMGSSVTEGTESRWCGKRTHIDVIMSHTILS